MNNRPEVKASKDRRSYNISRKGLPGEIADMLRKMIIRRDFSPGEKLPPERDLADKIGTNRNTLREAIRILESNHLVTVRQGSGVTVTDYKKDGGIGLAAYFLSDSDSDRERIRFLSDILFFRKQMLASCAELCAINITEKNLAKLRKTAESIQIEFYSGSSNDYEHKARMIELDLEFINHLIDGTESLPARWFMNELLPIVREILEKMKNLWIFPVEYPNMIKDIVVHIERGNPGKASNVLKDYFNNLDRMLLTGKTS